MGLAVFSACYEGGGHWGIGDRFDDGGASHLSGDIESGDTGDILLTLVHSAVMFLVGWFCTDLMTETTDLELNYSSNVMNTLASGWGRSVVGDATVAVLLLMFEDSIEILKNISLLWEDTTNDLKK